MHAARRSGPRQARISHRSWCKVQPDRYSDANRQLPLMGLPQRPCMSSPGIHPRAVQTCYPEDLAQVLVHDTVT